MPQRSQRTQREYSGDVLQHLTDVEHVRLRPAMYLGNAGKAGLHRMVLNLVDDSLDKASCGEVTSIKVTINRDGSASVEHNGIGIPVGRHSQLSEEEGRDVTVLETVMTKLHF